MDSLGEEWSADANEALEISLTGPGDQKPKDIVKFHPKFTYPIFGENETIYGYQGLKISLRFAAHDLKPCLEIKFDKKVKKVGDVEAEDIKEKMKESLPEDYITDIEQFERRIQNFDYQSFTPPGNLFNTYSLDGKTYEIWHANLLNEACREVLSNVQILVLFFIEGASLLDVDDEVWANRRWDVYFLYEKTPESRYNLTGYSTVYRYWHQVSSKDKNDLPFSPEQIHSNYPDTQPDPLPCRARISQFLILPPYQGVGHGGLFYDNLISHLLSLSLVKEITVEDPSDAFEDLRNLRDLTRLRKDGTFADLTLPALKPPANSSTAPWPYEAKRIKSKLAPRQFAKCVEMHLLSLDLSNDPKKKKKLKEDPRLYKQYKLLVKGRIYKQNRDLMAQLDRLERIDKLDETYLHVEDDYWRMLGKLEMGGPVDSGSAGAGKMGGDGSDEEMRDADDWQGGRPKKRVRK